MIKLTAITSEEEPHSTVAAFLIGPTLECHVIHAGDSRVYHFRGAEMVTRTIDHSYVQRLVDEGKITEEEANTHPQSNLLTGCLGTHQDPPLTHRPRRPARVRRHAARLQRRPVALLHPARARRHRARAAAARGQRDARRQGAPARPWRRRQPLARAGAHRSAGLSLSAPPPRRRERHRQRRRLLARVLSCGACGAAPPRACSRASRWRPSNARPARRCSRARGLRGPRCRSPRR